MNRKANVVIIAVFALFLGAFALLQPIMPDVEFSQQENKYLQMLPRFSLDALTDGDFTEDFERYTTDQFPFRDAWVALKARCELLTGKKENNGVYYCEGGVLIPDFDMPAKETVDRNVSYLNALVDGIDIPVYFGLIPGAGEVQASLLPKNAPVGSQQTVIDWAYGASRATNIDVQSALGAHKDEYIFYRTDHHWTSLGAFYGYGALCQALDLPAPSLASYDRQTVSEDFYGTSYSSSGFAWVRPDAIETGHDGPSILLIRDSYSDSLAPFLLENFSRVDLMDLRYYRGSPARYAEENGFDGILVLYSVSTFATDRNLYMLAPEMEGF